MKLGRFTIGPFLLAPMGGISQQPFRVLCRELGASLATTELIAPELLLDDATRGRALAFDAERERPFSVQLHGLDEALMARAALVAVEHGAEVIELNMGNPLRGAGESFLLEPERGARMISVLRRVTGVPITVKTRAGVHSPREVFALAVAVQDAGCAAIAVHPRTTRAKYSGTAAWDLLGELKQQLSMPVIGNGDVRTPDDAHRLLRETGCDAVMIGRAALGNPLLFKRLTDAPDEGAPERERVMRRHWALHRAFHGAEALRHFLPHLGWYARAVELALRQQAARVETEAQLEDFIGALTAVEPLMDPGLALIDP